MAVSWRTSVFQKMLCWNPYFIVFLGAHFWPSCKKGTLDPQQKNKCLADNLKAHFAFLGDFAFFWRVSFFCWEGLRVRWGGPKATTLGPKPSLSFDCFSPFLFLLLIEKNLHFPLKRAVFFNIECLPLFLLSLFGLPLFSLSLSLPLSCPFLSSFLRVFPFCFL